MIVQQHAGPLSFISKLGSHLPWHLLTTLGLITAATIGLALIGFTTYALLTLRREPNSK